MKKEKMKQFLMENYKNNIYDYNDPTGIPLLNIIKNKIFGYGLSINNKKIFIKT